MACWKHCGWPKERKEATTLAPAPSYPPVPALGQDPWSLCPSCSRTLPTLVGPLLTAPSKEHTLTRQPGHPYPWSGWVPGEGPLSPTGFTGGCGPEDGPLPPVRLPGCPPWQSSLGEPEGHCQGLHGHDRNSGRNLQGGKRTQLPA